jgi:hypothetical protein
MILSIRVEQVLPLRSKAVQRRLNIQTQHRTHNFRQLLAKVQRILWHHVIQLMSRSSHQVLIIFSCHSVQMRINIEWSVRQIYSTLIFSVDWFVIMKKSDDNDVNQKQISTKDPPKTNFFLLLYQFLFLSLVITKCCKILSHSPNLRQKIKNNSKVLKKPKSQFLTIANMIGGFFLRGGRRSH